MPKLTTLPVASPQPSKVAHDLRCDVPTYIRQIAFVTNEAATTPNPEVARLCFELLARQAPVFEALASQEPGARW